MILISHRGNLNGRVPERENHPDYIDEAISAGYRVEVDVRYIDNDFFLGHDEPQYKVDFDWLAKRNHKIWIHCKNIDALLFLRNNNHNYFTYFWHQNDDITLTSHKDIWAFPGKQPIQKSIAVLPEIYNDDISKAAGVCSDYIQKYGL